jgi:hypothetical protein
MMLVRNLDQRVELLSLKVDPWSLFDKEDMQKQIGQEGRSGSIPVDDV